MIRSLAGAAGRGGAETGFQRADRDSDTEQRPERDKEDFLAKARSAQRSDYLKSTRTAPLSRYEIKAGWEIPAVLEQALNSDLPGELKALVSSNVYDTATGRYLLIPQGSRLVGVCDSRVGYGQEGAQVVWDRIIYPDGSSLDLGGMIGQDAHGAAGFRDKVDRHYHRACPRQYLRPTPARMWGVIFLGPGAGSTGERGARFLRSRTALLNSRSSGCCLFCLPVSTLPSLYLRIRERAQHDAGHVNSWMRGGQNSTCYLSTYLRGGSQAIKADQTRISIYMTT